MPAEGVRAEGVGRREVDVPVPLEVDVDDVERTAGVLLLHREAAVAVHLDREGLPVPALDRVQVPVAVDVRPLHGIVSDLHLVPEEVARQARRRVGRLPHLLGGNGNHHPATCVPEKAVAGYERAIHPSVTVDVGEVPVVVVLVAATGCPEIEGLRLQLLVHVAESGPGRLAQRSRNDGREDDGDRGDGSSSVSFLHQLSPDFSKCQQPSSG